MTSEIYLFPTETMERLLDSEAHQAKMQQFLDEDGDHGNRNSYIFGRLRLLFERYYTTEFELKLAKQKQTRRVIRRQLQLKFQKLQREVQWLRKKQQKL